MTLILGKLFIKDFKRTAFSDNNEIQDFFKQKSSYRYRFEILKTYSVFTVRFNLFFFY